MQHTIIFGGGATTPINMAALTVCEGRILDVSEVSHGVLVGSNRNARVRTRPVTDVAHTTYRYGAVQSSSDTSSAPASGSTSTGPRAARAGAEAEAEAPGNRNNIRGEIHREAHVTAPVAATG